MINLEDQKIALKRYHYQRGLLSGYPIWAMSKFVKGKFTKDNLQQPSGELTDQYKTTLGHRSHLRFRHLDDEYIRRLEEIKTKSGLKEIIDSYPDV